MCVYNIIMFVLYKAKSTRYYVLIPVCTEKSQTRSSYTYASVIYSTTAFTKTVLYTYIIPDRPGTGGGSNHADGHLALFIFHYFV